MLPPHPSLFQLDPVNGRHLPLFKRWVKGIGPIAVVPEYIRIRIRDLNGQSETRCFPHSLASDRVQAEFRGLLVGWWDLCQGSASTRKGAHDQKHDSANHRSPLKVHWVKEHSFI